MGSIDKAMPIVWPIIDRTGKVVFMWCDLHGRLIIVKYEVGKNATAFLFDLYKVKYSKTNKKIC